MSLDFLIVSFASLLAILDPLAVVPVYLSLFPKKEQRKGFSPAAITSLAVFATLAVFMLFGATLLGVLGVSMAAFRVGGGILILLMALEMLSGSMSRVKRSTTEEDYEDRDSAEIVPLAIPLLAGPGAMTTAIMLSHTAPSAFDRIALFFVVLLVSAITFAVLKSAYLLQRVVGKTGIRITTRIMGLLLAAIGVQFMADGIGELFPALKIAATAGN